VSFSKNGINRSNSPESWVLVVVARMIVLEAAQPGRAAPQEMIENTAASSSVVALDDFMVITLSFLLVIILFAV
jgi:hypothetical protein